MFAELLAVQFAAWFAAADKFAPLELIESGAHDGTLAQDLLAWFRDSEPGLFGRLSYRIIEPSAQCRQWQRHTLEQFDPKVSWLDHPADLARASGKFSPYRILFANELLDAFPVRRWIWEATSRSWHESAVMLDAGGFAWTKLPPSPDRPPPEAPTGLLDILPNGFVAEQSPAAALWWRMAARHLGPGRMVAFDYGYSDEERWLPERSRGTLRAFSRHRAVSNVLARPGEQDITAHVDFGAIAGAGESESFLTGPFTTQERFLGQIAASLATRSETLAHWTPGKLRQFQTLTHPDQMGRAFHVLVQSRAGTS
jgi:SAM-dependent MidA family methyltransferase